jgi:hypothetical protein
MTAGILPEMKMVTADGDEIGLTAEVIFRGKTGDPAMDGHTEE